MTLESVAGRSYGPVTVGVDSDRVGAFVVATGDDPDRWESFAPPSFASALLFAVAPSFLSDPDVTPFTRSLIHSDQTFRWSGPLAIGGRVTVFAEVASVRHRSGMWFVGFNAATGGGTTVESESTFLMSDGAAAESLARSEPAATARGLVSDDPELQGSDVIIHRSASRADLVRYAAASGDFNPIHWDHDAARAAGLPGIVCHGLLAVSWVTQLAGVIGGGASPIRELKARFKRPLFPAVDAVVSASLGSSDTVEATVAADNESVVTAKLITA